MLNLTKNIKFYTRHSQGFTLVELAIVLVIIGLLTAGVVGGQSLIESAKKKDLISKITGMRTAYLAFKLEYDAIPGDMKDAAAYWGNDCNGATTGTDLCSGDGSKILDNNNIYTSNYHEVYRYWSHLDKAGIYPNSMTGAYVSGTYYSIGVNIPETKYKGVGIMATSNKLSLAEQYVNPNSPSVNLLRIVSSDGGCCFPDGAALTPKDAKAIDDKIDDGKPGLGRFAVSNAQGWAFACVNDGANEGIQSGNFNMATTTYKLSESRVACHIQYGLD